MDFALWKGAKPGEPFWASPWGNGRPGWHIECSAMVSKYLGDSIDIHCGGQDLIFPHHENEIAQSESVSPTGGQFARYWLHNGFIRVDSEKMSKSLGNFFTVREAAQSYGYENIRMFILMSHYRSPLNYSEEIMEQVKSAFGRIKTARGSLIFVAENGSDDPLVDEEISKLPQFRQKFIDSLDDDFNTADAIAVIFELIREINISLSKSSPSKEFAKTVLAVFDELTGVLGLSYDDDDEAELDADIEELIAARNVARKEKNWSESDRIRDKLSEMGITLEDTPQGVKWSRK